MQLLPLMQLLKGPTHGTASIIPAALHQIATSPTYAFEMTYETTDKAKPIIVPCQKVIALIRSHAKSTTESLGDGLKLTTQNVQCILHSGDEHPTGYTVTSVCTLSNLVAYRLDPPRGGSQCALATITNKIGEAYVVESIQLLSEEEAKAAQASMLKLIDLVAHFGQRDTKRPVAWTEESSPATARKCWLCLPDEICVTLHLTTPREVVDVTIAICLERKIRSVHFLQRQKLNVAALELALDPLNLLVIESADIRILTRHVALCAASRPGYEAERSNP